MKYILEIYETKTNKRPFELWLKQQEAVLKNKIIAKIDRVCLGNFSNCKPVGNGICEIIFDTGPGYRVYYTVIRDKIVLLLCAGAKKTQQSDIEKAKEYIQDYKERGRAYGKK
jgi:putative addiction module killer protein